MEKLGNRENLLFLYFYLKIRCLPCLRTNKHIAADYGLKTSDHKLSQHSCCCCCCSKVLRRHMAHRPSTSFMSVLYNLAKWLFLYSAYFSSHFFFIFFHFFIFFFGPQALFFLLTYMFFCFA